MKLYEKLGADNWVKTYRSGDTSRDRTTPTCLFGHLVREAGPLCFGSLKELHRVISLLYPERLSSDSLWGVAAQIGFFNDHADTTIEDILRVCKMADV